MPSQTSESSLLTCFGCLQPWMVGATSTLVVAAAIAPVHAASLTNWSFDPAANHLEVVVSDRTTPRYFLMAQPARIVLELPNTSVGAVKAQDTYLGPVRQIRVSQFQPGLTRIVMELAPGTSLAPGQVQLQQVSSDKWRLRPLIAQSTAPTPAPATSRRDPAPPTPTPAIVPSPAPTSVNAGLPSPPPLPAAPSPAPAPSDSSETPLPPSTPPRDGNGGESATIAVPPLTPSNAPPGQASVAPPATNATPRPSPSQQLATTAVPTPLPAAAVNASPVELPSTLPQSTSGSSAVRVSVPPLGAKPSAPPIVESSPLPSSALIVTPSSSAAARQPDASSLPIVGVPSSASVSPASTGSTVERVQPTAAPAPSSIVEFGQPLPSSQPTAPGTVLPAGTLLNLRYPGRDSLSLRTDSPHQEVLLLESEIRDAIGNLIFPQGSQVVGRFETNSAGSRFVAQAISVQGRNLPLNAQSGELSGNRRVSDDKLARNSGIGAIAGGLVGGFSGLGIVGGAAAGAAATFFTAPKPATIQPGQVVQVRLLQDLR